MRIAVQRQSGAVTATTDFVLSGAIDGHIRAYATADGALLWDYDTSKPFTTVNAVRAKGGSLDAGGPTIAGGNIFVNSGYGLYRGQASNVLIAFRPRPYPLWVGTLSVGGVVNPYLEKDGHPVCSSTCIGTCIESGLLVL